MKRTLDLAPLAEQLGRPPVPLGTLLLTVYDSKREALADNDDREFHRQLAALERWLDEADPRGKAQA